MVVLVEAAAGDGGVRTLETGGEHGAPLAFSWGCVQVAPPTQPLGNLADRCLAFWTRRPGLAHQGGGGDTLPLSGFDRNLWAWRGGSDRSERSDPRPFLRRVTSRVGLV